MPIKDDSLETYGRKHPVPQNVMDVEFKIVGDLTVRQFMYLVAGALLLFIIYKSQLPSFWMWIFMFIVTAISVAIAFVPIEERGMDIWMSNFVKSMRNPAQRIWKKTETMPSYFLTDYSESIKSNYTLTPIKNKNKLSDFLGQIEQNKEMDSAGTNEDTRLAQINIALSGTSSSSFVTTSQEKATKKVTEEKKPDIADIMVDEINTKRNITSTLSKPIVDKTVDRPLVNIPSTLKRAIKQKQTVKLTPKPAPHIEKPETPIKTPKITPIKKVPQKPEHKQAYKQAQKQEQLHKGQEKELKKQIKQPELEIKAIEDQKISLEKQVKELKETTRQAKEAFLNKPHNEKHKSNTIALFNKKLFELKTEREKIDFKINRKNEKKSRKNEDEQIEKLRKQNQTLETQLREIKEDLEQIKDTGSSRMVKPDNSKNANNTKQGEENIVTGFVKDNNGQLIEAAVIIIKDKNGGVVRALKSNPLGAFKAQTPIDNGTYTIEVIKNGKSFDIISIQLDGSKFEPVTLTAK